ncbi:hypothetical protein ASPZODRAFT_21838 [Penicilliopsis zonata CBS 506.65]|uniref:Uncharacterized protein n=1 Tax=Penicilliopsis zonata CBS 506.65 TaxID=1073090 RepID=A0A1L9SW80_9EURO|nr:hypothetical protein ASPZODRAFT_21838 [Penicilliopsis zonata CBS 506.65]OJJ51361.1 hypothetical protein ASPZODRAFT_21838 [Penicilliopsis zonata CBS 506.65]
MADEGGFKKHRRRRRSRRKKAATTIGNLVAGRAPLGWGSPSSLRPAPPALVTPSVTGILEHSPSPSTTSRSPHSPSLSPALKSEATSSSLLSSTPGSGDSEIARYSPPLVPIHLLPEAFLSQKTENQVQEDMFPKTKYLSTVGGPTSSANTRSSMELDDFDDLASSQPLPLSSLSSRTHSRNKGSKAWRSFADEQNQYRLDDLGLGSIWSKDTYHQATGTVSQSQHKIQNQENRLPVSGSALSRAVLMSDPKFGQGHNPSASDEGSVLASHDHSNAHGSHQPRGSFSQQPPKIHAVDTMISPGHLGSIPGKHSQNQVPKPEELAPLARPSSEDASGITTLGTKYPKLNGWHVEGSGEPIPKMDIKAFLDSVLEGSYKVNEPLVDPFWGPVKSYQTEKVTKEPIQKNTTKPAEHFWGIPLQFEDTIKGPTKKDEKERKPVSIPTEKGPEFGKKVYLNTASLSTERGPELGKKVYSNMMHSNDPFNLFQVAREPKNFGLSSGGYPASGEPSILGMHYIDPFFGAATSNGASQFTGKGEQPVDRSKVFIEDSMAARISASTRRAPKLPPGLHQPSFYDDPMGFSKDPNARMEEANRWFHDDTLYEPFRKQIADISRNYAAECKTKDPNCDPVAIEQTNNLLGNAIINLFSYVDGDREKQRGNFANFGDVAAGCYESNDGGRRSYFDQDPYFSETRNPPRPPLRTKSRFFGSRVNEEGKGKEQKGEKEKKDGEEEKDEENGKKEKKEEKKF